MEDIDYTGNIRLTPSTLPRNVFEEMDSNYSQFTIPLDLSTFRIEEWNYKSKPLVFKFRVKLAKCSNFETKVVDKRTKGRCLLQNQFGYFFSVGLRGSQSC